MGCQVVLQKGVEWLWPQKRGKTDHQSATLPVKANFWIGSPWRGKRKALLERGSRQKTGTASNWAHVLGPLSGYRKGTGWASAVRVVEKLPGFKGLQGQ